MSVVSEAKTITAEKSRKIFFFFGLILFAGAIFFESISDKENGKKFGGISGYQKAKDFGREIDGLIQDVGVSEKPKSRRLGAQNLQAFVSATLLLSPGQNVSERFFDAALLERGWSTRQEGYCRRDSTDFCVSFCRDGEALMISCPGIKDIKNQRYFECNLGLSWRVDGACD